MSSHNKPRLPVIIRYEGPGSADKPDWHLSDVCAFFPTEPGDDPRSMSCYSTIGEHASARSGYIGRKTKPATPAQVEAMLTELRRIGYDSDCELAVVARVSSHHTKVRREALKPRKPK